jgi:CheY-like chemotaxis protein
MDYINPEKIKVLIAEDDDASYTLLRILLSKMNFEIDRSFNGLETVEKVKNGNYGLVLMDMKMPKMSGYEATQKIREFNQDIKIIAATADALDRDKARAMESGCDDHLSKPIDTVLLKKVLNKVILNHE